ncbi:hypothetical protein V9K67_00625 [Paraflavisolibacter sp. H34]|uniref:hypothetical protein n=1 Tax=Huijunlia imazamoxiresistens TaxID=3127457 RepID=UPI003018ECCB
MLKKILFSLLALSFLFPVAAQSPACTLKPPQVTIHFGAGPVQDLNTVVPPGYERVAKACPNDGYYSYTSFTRDCFHGHWHTLSEDHTPGDKAGNMMLVNARRGGPSLFLSTKIPGLKSNATYEFGLWLVNVCKINQKCPFPLLPNITIRLQTPAGKIVAQWGTGELPRQETPQWTPFRALFTMPAAETVLLLSLVDNNPGGCGNDFALDDITFRECIRQTPEPTPPPKAVVKKQPAAPRPVQKKEAPVTRKPPTRPARHPQAQVPETAPSAIKESEPVFSPPHPPLPPPPPVLSTRANPLVREIETEAGEILLDLYDNGEIDGDTVSIYHNNERVVAHAALSQKPVSLRITVNEAQPRHELIMVAENLGTIPPNTSLMIVRAGTKRYEVFISSTRQKNAKVVIHLKE